MMTISYHDFEKVDLRLGNEVIIWRLLRCLRSFLLLAY